MNLHCSQCLPTQKNKPILLLFNPFSPPVCFIYLLVCFDNQDYKFFAWNYFFTTFLYSTRECIKIWCNFFPHIEKCHSLKAKMFQRKKMYDKNLLGKFLGFMMERRDQPPISSVHLDVKEPRSSPCSDRFGSGTCCWSFRSQKMRHT